ncbi:MAG: DUF58 domain-containing protein [Aquificaceae bacterium]|uniref:DUF58 domain-containing protein n=1 Tax=Hydrogenobacter sp. Uz 6-8 TaxID=3384828 RepID=UPI0030ACDD93
MKVRYRVRVNRAGLIFIGITIFLGVAAVNTANNLLYLVVSYMLSFMLLSGIISLYNLRGLEVVLIPPDEVYAGSRASFKVVVKNRKRLPSFLIVIRKEGSDCVFPLVQGEVEGNLPVVFEKRGLHPILDIEVSSTFPVGLFERFYRLEIPLNLIVFPHPVPAREKFLSVPLRERGHSNLQSRKRGYEELHGVREYSSEPIKLIHWKLSAKTGNLYVKEMVEESAPPVMLSLDIVDGSLEERISKLTHLIIKLTSEGKAVGLRLANRTIEPSTGNSHRKRLLTELALL